MSTAKFPRFEPSTLQRHEWRVKWERWIRGLEIHLQALKIDSPAEKKIQLLSLGGFEIQDIFFERKPAEPVADENSEDSGIDEYEAAKQV